MIEIYQTLTAKLKVNSFLSLFEKECSEICETSIARIDTLADYREAKEVWSLDCTELSLFKLLFDWREHKAREENRTKNHIAKDQELVEITKKKPESIRKLKEIESLHPRSVRLYGQEWLEITKEWQASDKPVLDKVVNPRDVKDLKALSSELESLVKSAAKQLKIPATLLFSKRMIRKLAYSLLTGNSLPKGWSGWREALLNEAVEAKKKQFVNL